MYVYSLICLGLTVALSKHIKTSSPFHCLALAWLYILDSIINAAYTAAFAVTWFLLVLSGGKKAGPGGDMMKDTGGFTDPKVNASKVEIIATPNAEGLLPGHDAVAVAHPASSPSGTDGTGVAGVLDSQSINSIGVICVLWTIRAYFCLVMLAWARSVVRQHIAIVSVRSGQYSNTSKSLADDPFAESKPEGQGWRGKVGRVMIAIGRTYFLGADESEEDESWVQAVGGKFRSHKHVAGHEGTDASANGIALKAIDARPTERERRRRSGTGPPLPEVQAQAAAIQASATKEGDDGLLKVPTQ